MAKNREPEKMVESSEEDDGASSEEIGSDESDSEPDVTQIQTQVAVAMKPSSSTPPAATLKETQPQSSKPVAASSSSSSSSGEEDSGSESDSESDVPDPNVKPIPMNPVDAAVASDLASPAKSPASKRLASPAKSPAAKRLAPPAKSAAAKRPVEETETEPKDSKKAKKSPAATAASIAASEPESSAKKKLFQRLWTEEDEVEILKGMMDYSMKKKADPLANLNDFHDFIRNNLHVEVTRTQLSDKIRTLKRKYVKSKNKGKERTFSNPLQQQAYELSKSIWGNDNAAEVDKMAKKPPATATATAKGVNDNDGKKSAVVVDVNDNGQKSSLFSIYTNGGDGSVEDNILRAGELMFEAGGKWVDKAKEWNKLKMEAVALMHRRLELKAAQIKLVLDCIKSNDD